MKLMTAPYVTQASAWPKTGRHILAQFDDRSIVVYQAYRPTIGRFATTHGYFGRDFSFNRMSWIKPNFLWMMYRSGWGTKAGQEVTLAIWIKRSAFDALLEEAVHSSFVPEVYPSETEWKRAVASSAVRLQWDPDHHPSGAKLERRAIQLGLRGDALARYAREWIEHIEDISGFVQQQRQHAMSKAYTHLVISQEMVYPVEDPRVGSKLGLSATD